MADRSSSRVEILILAGLVLAVAVTTWWILAVRHIPARTYGARTLMGFGAFTLVNWLRDAARALWRTLRRRRPSR